MHQFVAQVTVYARALGVALAQKTYDTGESRERAALKELLSTLDLVSSDIRFWSSGDTKTGPPDGVLTGPFWGPLDLCFIGGCRVGVVVGGGNLCRLTGGLPQASSSGGVGRRPALSDEEEPPACGRIRPLRRFWRSR